MLVLQITAGVGGSARVCVQRARERERERAQNACVRDPCAGCIPSSLSPAERLLPTALW